MSTKSRGTNRELQVVRQLRRDGYVAFRAPASLGVADVVALKQGEPSMLIEVKATAGGPYERFTPDKRLALSEAACKAGALAYLIWWPADRGGCRWIAERDWPPFGLSPGGGECRGGGVSGQRIVYGWHPDETCYPDGMGMAYVEHVECSDLRTRPPWMDCFADASHAAKIDQSRLYDKPDAPSKHTTCQRCGGRLTEPPERAA